MPGSGAPFRGGSAWHALCCVHIHSSGTLTHTILGLHCTSVPQGMQVIKDVRVDGLSVYWCPAKPIAVSDLGDSQISAWLGSMDDNSPPELLPDMHDVLPGLFFDMRLTTKHGE